ncbi:hypothetical protein J1614_009938 [Plenodomus biglobosus]|nr:hypothetical protein J1614_009938 [Plenodomus biglobosus]
MDYNYVPGPRDPRYMPGTRGQHLYAPAPSGPGHIPHPAASSGFYQTSSSGPGYTPTPSLDPAFYPSSSNGSAYMAQPIPSYTSAAPIAPSYSTSLNYSTNYSTITPSVYSVPSSVRRDSVTLGPGTCTLVVRQQPNEALHTPKDKQKMRKPVDSPPMVQLVVADEADLQQQYLQNPYLFTTVTLMSPDSDDVVDKTGKALMGTLVSSCQRLKDLANIDGAWFVFADISVMVLGTYRLGFTLHEFEPHTLSIRTLASTYSEKFDVVAAKDYKGLRESTLLTRSFAEQGVRLRLRKESKGGSMAKRRSSGSQGPVPHTPIRPAGQQPPAKRVKQIDGPPPPQGIPEWYGTRPSPPVPFPYYDPQVAAAQAAAAQWWN